MASATCQRWNDAVANVNAGRILIVDDDVALCRLLSDYLVREGFTVEVAYDGDAALRRVRERRDPPDLMILDVMMPGRDGLQTLRELRLHDHIPVIMLSARGEPVDRVVGLELGADDYLSKPCLPRELLARVRAQLRRGNQAPVGNIHIGVLEVFPSEHCAAVEGRTLALTGVEFMVLLGLAQHAGVVVDKANLTSFALGRKLERFDRSIDVHVSHLRHKLADASAAAPRIESVRGLGYVLAASSK